MSGGDLIELTGLRAPLPREPVPVLLEPAIAPQFFADTLARVDVLGAVARLILTETIVPLDVRAGGAEEAHVALKLIVPADRLRAIHDALGNALAAADGD